MGCCRLRTFPECWMVTWVTLVFLSAAGPVKGHIAHSFRPALQEVKPTLWPSAALLPGLPSLGGSLALTNYSLRFFPLFRQTIGGLGKALVSLGSVSTITFQVLARMAGRGGSLGS